MKYLVFIFSLIAFVGLSSFDVPNHKPEVTKVNLPPDNNVFSSQGQDFIKFQVLTGVTLANDIPCPVGACVCDNWRPASGNVNTGYYRACGCYSGGGFWYEYKACGYCVPEPNWGWECQNG